MMTATEERNKAGKGSRETREGREGGVRALRMVTEVLLGGI